ncbi:helix-turn-helix domain-containing protein [Chryseobacterium sp. JUb7]|uniref:winged helix-turn-helix transcriptional regulator n=1 Tax=Chryseobacterium sp. JUb7 TaxID=2940599 RepID=UPI002169A460|nr:helix-turn-helix domain-containing protein [Chryseobacterium sp. JUb7]MCS3529327.1 DNA-binding HxlR family transcriptional regulator [Chryseobacterium sp. JUb7]
MRKESSTNLFNEKAMQDFCNASKTLALISGRWKLSVLFKLLENDTYYSDFKILLPEISDRTLSRQLQELQNDGLISKEKNKVSSVYSLTDKGRKLDFILKSLSDFQD